MKFLTFDGRAVALLDEAPDWSGAVTADFSGVVNVERGLTGLESRRPLSVYLRTELSFSITVEGTKARELAGGLRRYQAEPIGVPLWPLELAWADRASRVLTGGVWLVHRSDWSQWALYLDGSEPVWPLPGDRVVPVLFGRLDGRDLKWPSGDIATFEVRFIEKSPAKWAFKVVDNPMEEGPKPSDAYTFAPYVFGAQVNFDQGSQSFSVEVQRNQIGFGREEAETLYPQETGFEQQTDHIAQGEVEIGKLLSFFQTHLSGRPFWVPTWTCATMLVEDIGPLVSQIPVEDTVAIEIGDWLAFMRDQGTVIRKVTIKTGSTLFLDSAPGATSENTQVCPAKLVRFVKPSVRVSWLSGDVVASSMAVREVPEEYVPADGEELGITLGQIWHRIYLYEITERVGGFEAVDRLTSHEEDVEADGVFYSSARITHGNIRQGVALDLDEADLTVDLGASDIIARTVRLRSRGPVHVTIKEASVTRLRQFSDDFEASFQ